MASAEEDCFITWQQCTKKEQCRYPDLNLGKHSSGTQRVIKWSPIPMKERKGNPRIDFLMVIMASSIACGCIHKTTKAELPKILLFDIYLF